MDDKQLLAVLERQRYRATALDVSLKTGATVEDSEGALAAAALERELRFRGETVVYIFPSNVKSKLGAAREREITKRPRGGRDRGAVRGRRARASRRCSSRPSWCSSWRRPWRPCAARPVGPGPELRGGIRELHEL